MPRRRAARRPATRRDISISHNQPAPYGSWFSASGDADSASLTATTVPDTGAYTSLTDLVLSTSPKLSPAATAGADRGHLHVHHVAQRILRVVGDADACTGAVDGHPLVIAAVAEVLRNLHGRRP